MKRFLINISCFALGVSLFLFFSFLYVAVSDASVDCSTLATRSTNTFYPIGTPSTFKTADGYRYSPANYQNNYTGCFTASEVSSYGDKWVLWESSMQYRTYSIGAPCDNGGHIMTDTTWSAVKDTCNAVAAHCSDGVKSGDEIGIDCGGACAAECVERCPPGMQRVYIQQTDSYDCAHILVPDAYGNCPPQYGSNKLVEALASPPLAAGEKVCVQGSDPIIASQDVELDPVEAPPGWESGTLSVISGSNSTVTNNPDGTSTVTTTTTTTATNPQTGATESTTTTTTDTYSGPNGSGTKTGTNQATTGTTSPEENPSNYNFNPDIPVDSPISLQPSEYGDGPDWESLKHNIDTKIDAVESAILGTTIETSAQTCEITFTLLNRTMTISFCQYESILNTAGALLLSITYVLGMIYLWERG